LENAKKKSEGKKRLTVRVKMTDKSTLHTVAGVEAWTLYAILKNARIFLSYFENEKERARLCPKPDWSLEAFSLEWLCCHDGPEKVFTVTKICGLDHHLVFHKQHVSVTAALLAHRLKDGRGGGGNY
jgi:hypothetical protein